MLPRNLYFRIQEDGSAERFQKAPLVYRRPALYSILNQLSGSRGDFIRIAIDLQGLPPDIGNQGSLAFLFFLVVRAHASSHWLVRRPIQFALALCRSIRPVVIRAGTYGPRRQPCRFDWVPRSSVGRVLLVLPRSNQNRWFAVRP